MINIPVGIADILDFVIIYHNQDSFPVPSNKFQDFLAGAKTVYFRILQEVFCCKLSCLT